MTPITISSCEDPRVAAYLNVRERDLIGREGLFVVEGEVVLRVFLTSTLVEPISILVSEDRLESLCDVFTQIKSSVAVYVASQAIMDKIVGFHIHRGILALGRRQPILSSSDLLQTLNGSGVVVGLIGVSNHDNMGGIFRNAAALGVKAVIADATSCDPFYRKSIRVSVGGVFRVPFARSSDVIGDLHRFHFTPLALSPSGNTELSKLEPPPRSGVILGAEGPGLPEKVLEKCQTVRIAMAPLFDSLNVATTSGIVLHHLGSATSRFASP